MNTASHPSNNHHILDNERLLSTLFIMKQPALGQKISELRKRKGFTQEELVDKCNISVRTIQRIEAGEVTPRSYTIKTILSALDYDLESIAQEDSPLTSGFKKLILLEIDDSKKASFLINHLRIAWISGIVYFLLGFAELYIEYYRYNDDQLVVTESMYIVIKLLTLLSLVLFTRGFVVTGKILNNYLLRITAFIFICIGVLFYLYDIVSLYTMRLDYQFILGAEAITYGVIGILFGIAVLRLKDSLGTISLVTGVFELITYGFMVTVLLSIVGMFMLTPTIILEIILLYKVTEMVKEKVRNF
ncbi:helix-turn-helix domain-containing protein [Aquimarina intermedia]|uniref:Helix-turn-helix protein n=1 Tax=Aquimarina intermedia TaxID=350814 RepID=A0A5S5C9U6_9FLAO|nr:helix-turn-helix domain-containing protein [Aquimarina intermedia]TYP76181.1 helix-turn-helix protein [Aquimarina intermedia]